MKGDYNVKDKMFYKIYFKNTPVGKADNFII